jgi:FkbM family methyltransferase
MGFKQKVGSLLNNTFNALIRYNYKSTPFIPNGRILPLDLKRANIYPGVIFDVGANIGQTANYFIKHFPQSDIYCFEPVKDTYDQLVKNTKSDKIHTINEGLGSEIQELTIQKNNSSGSSSLKANDGRFFEKEVVKINTGQNFCDQNKIESIDLLKMDVEGFETAVLQGFGPLLRSKVKMIYSEVGFEKEDDYKTHISDLLAVVSENGFIVSGFYEPYRWGKGKLKVFYNVLLVNTTLIDI